MEALTKYRSSTASPSETRAALERSRRSHSARVLGRHNELLHASRAYSTWAAATQECKLQRHMRRCSTMLKRNSIRLVYTRYFMRWLAFTQSNTMEAARCAIRLRQDVPLRSKADFLALARRYFLKWRTCLRERMQRTVTNVKLLDALNRNRLRTRTLFKWWQLKDLKMTQRHSAEMTKQQNVSEALYQNLKEATHNEEVLREKLDGALRKQAQLQYELEVNSNGMSSSALQRQAEVDELRQAMQEAIKLLEGSSSQRLQSLPISSPDSARLRSVSDASIPHSPTPQPSSKLLESARQSTCTAEALLGAVKDALLSLASAARIPTPPASLNLCLAQLAERRVEEAKDAASIKAQRDDLLSVVERTCATLAAASPLLRADPATDAGFDSNRELSQTRAPSRTDVGPKTSSLQSTNHIASDTRSTGSRIVPFGRNSSAAVIVDGTSGATKGRSEKPPCVSFTDAQKLSRRLVEDAKAVVESMRTASQDNRRYADEVRDLQNVALHAIEVLGGRSAADKKFIGEAKESKEARAIRSRNISVSLRNLCEDMLGVLVKTSLWSTEGASEKVSVALERQWHQIQGLEASQVNYRQQLEEYTTVVRTSVALLRPPLPTPPSTMSHRTAALLARRRHSTSLDEDVATPEQLSLAHRSAEHLAAKGDHKPAHLIELCVEAQKHATAGQPNPPASEWSELLRKAKEFIAITVGKNRCGELEARSSSAAALHNDRHGTSSIGSHATDLGAGVVRVSSSQSTDLPSVEVMTSAFTTATAVAAATLRKSEAVPHQSLLDALLHAYTQICQLKEDTAHSGLQLSDIEEREKNERKTHQAKVRQLEDELREVKKSGEACCEAYKKQVKDLEKALDASTLKVNDTQQHLWTQLKTAERQRISDKMTINKQQEEICQIRAALNDADAAKRQIRAALEEAVEQNTASERAFRSQLDDVAKTHDVVETNVHQHLKTLQSESAQSAQRCQHLEHVLRELEEDNRRAKAALHTQTETSEAERRHHAEEMGKLQKEMKDLQAQLSTLEKTNRTSHVIGRFLSDILRDCLARLHHLTQNIAAAVTASEGSPLDLPLPQPSHCTSPPHALTNESDPSQYVEYILRMYDRDTVEKRLVRKHLREGMPTRGSQALRTKMMTGATDMESLTTPAAHLIGLDRANPSTWEIVAELHDCLIMLYGVTAQMGAKEVGQGARTDEIVRERDRMMADVLAALAELEQWSSVAAAASTHGRHPTVRCSAADNASSLPEELPLRASCGEVTQALEDIERIVLFMRPSEVRLPGSIPSRASVSDSRSTPGAKMDATRRLPSLVEDLQNMARCLRHLSEAAAHGIFALGGMTDEMKISEVKQRVGSDKARAPTEPARADGSPTAHLMRAGLLSESVEKDMLAARLRAVCRETGASAQEVKRLLYAENGDVSISTDSSKQVDSEPVKLSEILPVLRTKMQESLEVKQEVVQMLAGLNQALYVDSNDSCSSMSSGQRSLKPKQKPLPAFQRTPEAGLRLLRRQKIRFKTTLKCRADVLSLLRDTRGMLRTRMSDIHNLRHVCCLTLRVLEGNSVTGEHLELEPTAVESLGVLLTTQIEDLKQVLPETEEALAGYRSNLQKATIATRLHLLSDAVRSLTLERDSLKEDLACRFRQCNNLLYNFTEDTKALRAEIAHQQQTQKSLDIKKEMASDEMSALHKNTAEMVEKLKVLQQERDMWCDALVQTLCGLNGTPYHGIPHAEMQRRLLTSLAAGQSISLSAHVAIALRSANASRHRLHKLLRDSLLEIRHGVEALRAQVTGSWRIYGQHMATAMADQLREMTDVLTCENNMLRPRAIEREQLRREKAQLEATLAEVQKSHADVINRLESAEDENMQLRRAVRDAQVAQALANLDGEDSDTTERDRKTGKTQSTPVVNWERRMIDGATELAMSAVDSMSSAPMAAAFDSVVEETLRIYSGVQRCLRGIELAYSTARSREDHHVQKKVTMWLRELGDLARSADHLWMHLSIPRRVPYLYGE